MIIEWDVPSSVHFSDQLVVYTCVLFLWFDPRCVSPTFKNVKNVQKCTFRQPSFSTKWSSNEMFPLQSTSVISSLYTPVYYFHDSIRGVCHRRVCTFNIFTYALLLYIITFTYMHFYYIYVRTYVYINLITDACVFISCVFLPAGN